jgi:hypothetical protein
MPLRWVLVLPFALFGVAFAWGAAWLTWTLIGEMIPLWGSRIDPYAVAFLRCLMCPMAFVAAGAQMAPAYQTVVAITLCGLYLLLIVATTILNGLGEHWRLVVFWLVVQVVSAIIGVFTAHEQSEIETERAERPEY